MKNVEKFWDRISKNYDKNDKVDNTYIKMLDIMKKYLDKDDIVMDFGCATGSIAIDIADRVSKVIGIDISSKMIAIAKEKAMEHRVENVQFAKSTIFDQSHKERSYDVILVFNILHLLDDTDEAIRRINEILKPGGIFISSTACLGDKGKFVGGVISLIGKLGFLPNSKKFRVSELVESISQGGFEIIEVVSISEPSHPFIIAKKIL